MASFDLTTLHVFRNAISLGYPILESLLSVYSAADHVIICVDPEFKRDLHLAKHLQQCYSKVTLVEYSWPIGQTGDGSVIGLASEFALRHVRTSHVLNVQADEIYDPVLINWVQKRWKKWAQEGNEVFSFKICHTEHNAQSFQGGELWNGSFQTNEWNRAGYLDSRTNKGGAGYRNSYKLVRMCEHTRFLHDAWSFDWRNLKVKHVAKSEHHPIVHLHDFHRDSLIAIRRNASNSIWPDKVNFGDYHTTAQQIEHTRNTWWSDDKWTRRSSPFSRFLPPYAQQLIGITTYRVNWPLFYQMSDLPFWKRHIMRLTSKFVQSSETPLALG